VEDTFDKDFDGDMDSVDMDENGKPEAWDSIEDGKLDGMHTPITC
jgi:hypothetical protein